MTHLEHLLGYVPDLGERKILDVGSGKGGFLIDAAKRGMTAEGLEHNPAYIVLTESRAREAGVRVQVRQGEGERLPFEAQSFSFVNVCEVLEHVQDPGTTLSEVARVLTKDGVAYVSIPNRYGFMDPHFKAPFVNWLPRSLAPSFLKLIGKEKNEGHDAGHQELSEMHYLTRGGFVRLLRRQGLTFTDTREVRLRRLPLGILLIPLYRAYASLFIPTFHGLARLVP